MSPERAAAARERARGVRTFHYPIEPFSRRVWELRHSLSAYVALAEWLNTDLVTADERLARADGPHYPDTPRLSEAGNYRAPAVFRSLRWP